MEFANTPLLAPIRIADIPNNDIRIDERRRQAVAVGAEFEGRHFMADIRHHPKRFARGGVPDTGGSARGTRDSASVGREFDAPGMPAFNGKSQAFFAGREIKNHDLIVSMQEMMSPRHFQ